MKVFDIRRSTYCPGNDNIEYTCQSVISYATSYEDVIITGGTLIPSSNQQLIGSKSKSKIAVLLDTGRLNFLTLTVDLNGKIEDGGDFTIGCEEGVSFPTEGIRRCGLSAEPPGATARSLGEGQLLKYLHQSGLLLYKCTSSPLIAFMVDNSGKILKSFEFLPHVLSKEMCGSHITSPYTHWTELGTTQRNGSTYYRATFTGRSTKMNQPKMMYVEFNDHDMRLSEIKTSSNSLTLAINTSLEGNAALSSPILIGSKNGMVGDNSNYFHERIFLLSISSNGSIVVLGEELEKLSDWSEVGMYDMVRLESTKRRRALSDSALSPNKKEVPSVTTSHDESRKTVILPHFPLTMFEDLINVSEHANLLFGGDCVKDPAVTKRRLSMNSGEFIVSPNNDGCTLTVSLQPPQSQNQHGVSSCTVQSSTKGNESIAVVENIENKNVASHMEKLAIVAVRILLGSTTTDFIPKDIAVMGRRIKLSERMKRWYDVPLTDEEIILGIKGGAVTISIGASPDTSNPPLIDSVEVFAQEKRNLQYLFPALTGNDCGHEKHLLGGEENRKTLDTSILSIAHVCNLLDNKVDLSSQLNLQTLRRLIQVTALDPPENGSVRRHVVDLVKAVESNQHSMQMLLDEGTLQGISSMLDDLTLKGGTSTIHSHRRDKVISRLNDCLNVTLSIAKERPDNYKAAIENLISSGFVAASIALQARKILKIFTSRTLVFKTSPKVIQLSIFEAMITECSSANFADLELVTEILKYREEAIVRESCNTLVETMKEIQTFGKVQAYQCDGCSAFPITGTRYTLEDKNIDLCMSCFDSGNKYARSKNFRSGTPVLVNDRKLQMEGGKVMSCSQISQMTTKLVPANILEQVREANALREGEDITLTNENDDDEEDDADLKMALKMSLETQSDQIVEPECQRTISYIIHMNLITKLLEDIEESLSKENQVIHHPIYVIDLLLKLVVQCDSPDDQFSFGKKICEVICSNLFRIIESYRYKVSTNDYDQRNQFGLVIYIRALEALSTSKESILTIINTKTDSKDTGIVKDDPPMIERSKDKTDPRFICEDHGIPAVRRR